MDWENMYLQSNKPTFSQIGEYINSPLWQELNDALNMTYNVIPQIEYSKCSMQRGWNVKYKKKGKSLCTLYPEQDYFRALIVINERHVEVDLFVETFCDYIKKLYRDTKFFNGSKWLMIDIKESITLEDVKELISIRAR